MMRTREEMLEAALRIALRKLGGELYVLDRDELDARPAEGAIVFSVDNAGRPHVEMSGVLTNDECVAILNAIDEREDPIVEQDGWHDVYAGNVRYRTAAGHTVEIFNDCDCWDYVDSITHADGRRWDFFDGCGLPHADEEPGHWSPDRPEAWGIRPSVAVSKDEIAAGAKCAREWFEACLEKLKGGR